MRISLVVVLGLIFTTAMGGSGQLLGGYKKHDDHSNDARVQEAAKFAVDKLGEQRNEKLDLIKVVSAHTQVVAGTNYKLLLDIANSDNKMECVEATVYAPLGNQEKQLTSTRKPTPDQIEQQTEATSERKNGGLLGGYKEVSTDDEEVLDAANFAAEQLSQRSNSLYPFKVKEVLQAKTKVANGRVFDLAIKLSQGDLSDQIMKVEVSRDLKNTYLLTSSSPATS
ncbi:Cystatin/monellin [Coccomyxa subellipsoidea C-169]|uniref:Cystatin/monellin n=1 Tax=Coccomyxa subellipsoidea (strain C-169) TaxID=574566 RepID=I0YL91_COCSC|nr:Cystatin/monellin [Coccomyxa subellipsoidea C-169]EIE19160.1 Cystatin/monellin [Coccomyxa subellipsoidea C-169]|eukprot:XP_005643704.1 Cystatin/monellin [Coccomyxa subellipsoidea C-169]